MSLNIPMTSFFSARSYLWRGLLCSALLAASVTVCTAQPARGPYRVYVPPNVRTPAPVVLNFHGYTGSAAQQEAMTGMNATADARGFIVVYPEGIGGAWNAGGCCTTVANDVTYVRQLLDDLSQRIPIDRHRIYATGFSNGGMMAYRLACEAADLIAAIAPVSGTMGVGAPCAPSRPVPVAHFHSLRDPMVPYVDGVPSAYTGQIYQGVESTLGLWYQRNACTAPVQQTFAGPGYSCFSTNGCVSLCLDYTAPASTAHTWNAATWNKWANEIMWDYVFAPNVRP